MSSVNNKIIFNGTKKDIENLLGYLIKMSICKTYSSDEDTREMVRVDSDVDVKVTSVDLETMKRNTLELGFDSQISPSDVFVKAIHDKFPNIKIDGWYKFYDEDEKYSWTDELELKDEDYSWGEIK